MKHQIIVSVAAIAAIIATSMTPAFAKSTGCSVQTVTSFSPIKPTIWEAVATVATGGKTEISKQDAIKIHNAGIMYMSDQDPRTARYKAGAFGMSVAQIFTAGKSVGMDFSPIDAQQHYEYAKLCAMLYCQETAQQLGIVLTDDMIVRILTIYKPEMSLESLRYTDCPEVEKVKNAMCEMLINYYLKATVDVLCDAVEKAKANQK